jgi:hypothetical protein
VVEILSSDVNRKGSSDETNSGLISLQTNGEREKEKKINQESRGKRGCPTRLAGNWRPD